jgi:hypothetical protein
MHTAELLGVWERGGPASHGERALLLLSVAQPQAVADAGAGWTVGQRDRALFALREELFGARLTALATCPRCGEPLEMEFQTADVVVDEALQAPPPLSLEQSGYRVTYRPPTAEDLAVMAQEFNGDEAQRWLLGRCVLDARRDQDACSVAELPASVLRAVADGMAAADPQADVELALTCPACSHQWQAPFDIVSFLWRELDAWARRTLAEVATLASALGWSEQDILALTPWRRRHYLELAVG